MIPISFMHRRNLLFPEPVADHGEGVAEIADSETVCGCLGVSKGQIISGDPREGHQHHGPAQRVHARIHRLRKLLGNLPADSESRRAAIRRRDQEGVVFMRAVHAGESARDHPSQQLRSVQDVLDIYGNGAGCEVCKPALSYLVDVVWCGDHEEDRSARFINDRVHANIQNDGTFSVIPRIRGGVTSPAELRRIANAAEKYTHAW